MATIETTAAVRGTVKFFLAPHGYGFAILDGAEPDAPEVYLHWSQIIDQDQPRKTLVQGQAIQFQIVRGKNGRLAAINIQSAEEGGGL